MIPRLLALACVLSLSFGNASLSAQTPDEAARVTRRFEPIYPGTAITRGVSEGYAKVYFWIDELGTPSDFLVYSHSGEWFGNALVDALKDWQFEPKIENGGPVGSVYFVEWHFVANQVVELNTIQAAGKKFQKDPKFGDVHLLAVDPSNLDNPASLREVYPIYVKKKNLDRVVIEVECFIDPEGNVKLPTLIEDNADDIDNLALDRFKKWKFDPPTKDGKPTLVFMRKQIIVPVVEQK